jgi:N-methylhydantoinase A
MARGRSELRVAIDTGGTFTDCVWVEGGVLKTLKVFSTPDDPSRAIAEGLGKIGAGSRFTLLHGTTVGTNALLQRKGARVALIKTSSKLDVRTGPACTTSFSSECCRLCRANCDSE